MFTTCLHCHSSLGANDAIEHFPVGRRLAFDEAKGRLWVVCAVCKRWNLTPLEERWEAIEECERLYRKAKLRTSTGDIALARPAHGPDLVRIGAPKAPEMATWRYVREFKKRWMHRGVPLGLLVGGAFQGAQLATNQVGSGTDRALYAPAIAALGILLGTLIFTRSKAIRLALPNGRVQLVSRRKHAHVRLAATEGGWGVHLGEPLGAAVVAGAPAVHTLRAVMTVRNFAGASRRTVDAAVAHLAEARTPNRFIERLARASEKTRIWGYPADMALALEMALHEGAEQPVDGELSQLRVEWELAEEIASIADDMLISEGVRSRLSTMTVPGTS